jgi:hypothetical protein
MEGSGGILCAFLFKERRPEVDCLRLRCERVALPTEVAAVLVREVVFEVETVADDVGLMDG